MKKSRCWKFLLNRELKDNQWLSGNGQIKLAVAEGVDFLSQGVVKSNFREIPVMIKWRIYELIGLKRVEIPKHPLREEVYVRHEAGVFQRVQRNKK